MFNRKFDFGSNFRSKYEFKFITSRELSLLNHKVFMLKIIRYIIVFLFFSTSVYNTCTFAQSDWEFDAALYGWFAGMEGTIGVATVDEQFEVEVSDLLPNLKFTAGGHFEARNPNLSFIADVFFVGLGQKRTSAHYC
jgi:hypothetical protein